MTAGWVYTRPEALYFWFYFVIVNLIWIIIPSLCALRASKQLLRAVTAQDRYAFLCSDQYDALYLQHAKSALSVSNFKVQISLQKSDCQGAKPHSLAFKII